MALFFSVRLLVCLSVCRDNAPSELIRTHQNPVRDLSSVSWSLGPKLRLLVCSSARPLVCSSPTENKKGAP